MKKRRISSGNYRGNLGKCNVITQFGAWPEQGCSNHHGTSLSTRGQDLSSCLLHNMRTALAKCAQSSGTGKGLIYKILLLPRHLTATGAHIDSDLRNFQIFSIKQFQLLIIFTNDLPHKSISWS